MVKIKVIDSHNASFSWIAEKCKDEPKSAIFVFSKIAKHLMLLNLIRYGIKNIPVDFPEKFFASLIKKHYCQTHDICNQLKKQPYLFNDKKGFERDLIIWRCVRTLLTEKANMNNNMYKENPLWNYITPEQYETFKNAFTKLNITTGFDVIKECMDRNIKTTVKNLFILGYEDGYKLLYEAIDKCIIPEKIYYIGDPYRYSILYSNCNDINFNETIDLNASLQIPANMYNYFTQVKDLLKVPYNIKPNNAFGKVSSFNSLDKALNYLYAKQFDLACIVYETPMYADYIETSLFNKNIPFKGVTERYKFPFELYVIFNVMENVCNNKGIITYKEIKTLIDSIRGEITDKFGGKKQLLKMYSLPTISGATLHKTTFFKYLIKVWVSSNFNFCLQEDLARKWIMWKGKLNKRWYSPNIYCGIVTSMKYLNPDISLCIASLPEEKNRLAYTMLTITKNELIFV